ncbi:MAG TPA: hypothetical protein VF518_04370, partial [Polyangia bacterium]
GDFDWIDQRQCNHHIAGQPGVGRGDYAQGRAAPLQPLNGHARSRPAEHAEDGHTGEAGLRAVR